MNRLKSAQNVRTTGAVVTVGWLKCAGASFFLFSSSRVTMTLYSCILPVVDALKATSNSLFSIFSGIWSFLYFLMVRRSFKSSIIIFMFLFLVLVFVLGCNFLSLQSVIFLVKTEKYPRKKFLNLPRIIFPYRKIRTGSKKSIQRYVILKRKKLREGLIMFIWDLDLYIRKKIYFCQ